MTFNDQETKLIVGLIFIVYALLGFLLTKKSLR